MYADRDVCTWASANPALGPRAGCPPDACHGLNRYVHARPLEPVNGRGVFADVIKPRLSGEPFQAIWGGPKANAVAFHEAEAGVGA